jgi:large subunit ribosomal protein L22
MSEASAQAPQIKAIAKGIRISPRKVGVVASLVKKRTVKEALTILEHTPRAAALPITKLINSAAANARHNLKLSADEVQNLDIATIMVTEGTTMKRYKFVGHGRRARPRPMLKRSSHITIILGKLEPKSDSKSEAKSSAKLKSQSVSKPKSSAKASTSKSPAKPKVQKTKQEVKK